MVNFRVLNKRNHQFQTLHKIPKNTLGLTKAFQPEADVVESFIVNAEGLQQVKNKNTRLFHDLVNSCNFNYLVGVFDQLVDR